jgi:hypothetical protein
MQLLLIARPECPLQRERASGESCIIYGAQRMICRSNVNVIQSEGKPRTPLTQSCAATRVHCSFCFYFSSRALSRSIYTQKPCWHTPSERASRRRFLSHSPFRFICRTSGAERVSKDIARPGATLGARLRNASPDFKLIKWSSKRRCDTRAIPSFPPCA